MKLSNVILVAVGVVFSSGCAAEPLEDTASSSTSLASPAPTRCLVPVDVDGDGVGDVMRPSNVVTTDPMTCRTRYGGAVVSADLVPALSSDGLRTRTTPGAGGGGGTTYTAGTGLPPAVANAVNQFDLHHRETYRPGYTCRHFSRDLERFLQLEGFHATYTIFASGKGRQRYGHAIVDVHIGGVAWWIEPQTGLPFDLDEDGDGDVETTGRGGYGNTNSEGPTSIEVFESYDEMVATYPDYR